MALLIFTLALALRLLHLWLMRDSPLLSVLMGDARAYDEWATRLAGGDWIGRDVFYQAPLYPYFLGAIYSVFGRDFLIVRIIQAVLGAASALLLAAAATRVFSARAGVIAGLLLACYAPAIFLSVIIQKAVLDVLLVCVAIWALAHIDRTASDARWSLVLGLSLGLLSLSRENALVLLPVAFWFVRRGGALAFVIGVALVLTPVAVRNYAVDGRFYLTTSQFGPNLYIGNNPRADGTYQALREGRGDAAFERQDATEIAQAAAGRTLSPAEVSVYWRDRALAYIATSPADWLQLQLRKLRLLISAREMPDTEAQESYADESFVLRLLQPWGHFGLMLPLALLGVVVTWPDRTRLGVFYALTVTYALSVLLFFVFARYRYPLVPFVLFFAAAGLAALPAFLRESSGRQLAVVGAAVAALAVVAHLPVLAADVLRAVTATNVGVALQAEGRLDEAAAQYRRAAAIRPDYAPAHNNLGVVLSRRGQVDEAIAAYRQAMALHPTDAGVHLNLAEALLRQGRVSEAVTHFRHRVELDPEDLARRYDLGNVLLQARDAVAAEREFRELTRRAPDAPQGHARLGVALAAQERYDDAITSFERALALRPDYAEARKFLEMARQARTRK